ncbi:triple tyrosine motif-containing protein [Polaribacter sp. Asnod1-A03]|uniref:helix-turn-helix and ligand-binding sensor domain-containing protein n=1 Tax=Polaribacter sp. Asnod1-A03 TaxID=3160581 RepID=UPI003870D6B4
MKIFHFTFFFFIYLISFSQELPPIENFSASVYGGDNQNWMISQSEENYIYVANNKGLLEYNGSKWNTYASPNNTKLRAVNAIGNRIYTGCHEEFGYWLKNEYGTLEYTSLIPKLGIQNINNDRIWNIVDYNEWVLFQSSHGLYFYNKNTEEFKTITSKNIIYKVFNVENQIYYHVANEGIYCIKNGETKLLNNNKVVINDRVINLFKVKDDIVVLTRSSGFFKIKNEGLITWNVEANNRLKELSIFNSIQLKDGSFIAGTISNGIVKITNQGKIEYLINQKLGLSNNTVLSLFEDNKSNVWVALDNGIDYINMKSPLKTFIDYDGVLGTVYSTIIFNDFLYVGTNQGLFYRPLNKTNEQFILIKGTAGQVWSLYNDNDKNLFCGHHLGTFLIEKGKSKKISFALGAWNFKKIPNHKDLILQGNYDGLYILEYKKNTWSIRNKIEGFNNSSRFFELSHQNKVLVNHEYKGVFDISLNEALTKATSVTLRNELSIGENSSLITYQNKILYTSNNGIYEYNSTQNNFKKDTLLSPLLASKTYTSGKMTFDKTGKLWMFSKNNISFITNNNLTNTPETTDIYISSNLKKGVLGFENIQYINNEKYIIGIVNGYLTIDLSKLKFNKNHTIFLNNIHKKDIDSKTARLSLTKNGEFDHKQGILSFDYSIPEYYKYLDVTYQYRLLGNTDRWSNWSKNANIQFENLSYGDYKLEVKGKVGNQTTKNIVSYTFKVNKPWYISNLLLLIYFITFICIGFLIHKTYKFYYGKILKHEQVKNDRTIIEIKNEKLNQDIESKNRELAISTMSIVKKNELLRKIKKELKNVKDNEDVESAVNLIENNLNNNKDWKFFKQAFNNADKDFMDKIKAMHPELTSNDLKFCAYLRLNLSSKEIAPLLNISTKSVETKRYRLRKKMNLQHDESLVGYILKF